MWCTKLIEKTLPITICEATEGCSTHFDSVLFGSPVGQEGQEGQERGKEGEGNAGGSTRALLGLVGGWGVGGPELFISSVVMVLSQ